MRWFTSVELCFAMCIAHYSSFSVALEQMIFGIVEQRNTSRWLFLVHLFPFSTNTAITITILHIRNNFILFSYRQTHPHIVFYFLEYDEQLAEECFVEDYQAYCLPVNTLKRLLIVVVLLLLFSVKVWCIMDRKFPV